jgi:hypothetical protein
MEQLQDGKQAFVTGGNDCKLRIWSLLSYDLEVRPWRGSHDVGFTTRSSVM